MGKGIILFMKSRNFVSSSTLAIASVVGLESLGALIGRDSIRLQIDILALAIGISVSGSSLGAYDASLERTAAIRWLPRRIAHLTTIVALTGAPFVLVQMAGTTSIPSELVVRLIAGLTGLAAIGATVLGSELAWTGAMSWAVLTVATMLQADTAPVAVVAWMNAPPGTMTANVTATALAAVGSTAFTVRVASLEHAQTHLTRTADGPS